jgi:hypothetical protein
LLGELLHWLAPSGCGLLSDSVLSDFVLVFVEPPTSSMVGSAIVKVVEFAVVFGELDVCFPFRVVESLFRLISDRLFLLNSSFGFPCMGLGG